MTIKAIIFDKDGTLFDFQKSWGKWGAKLISELANGEKDLMLEISRVLEYDLETKEFQKSSQFIAGTVAETANLIASVVPEKSVEQIIELQLNLSLDMKQHPVKSLKKTIDFLSTNGFVLGVVTNDLINPTRNQLIKEKILSQFELILGQDSGHGSKPDPSPLLAFCKHCNLEVEEVVMVGDSAHDLTAAKNARILGVGVLTGLASKTDLLKHSEYVIPDISYLPSWLKNRGQTRRGFKSI